MGDIIRQLLHRSEGEWRGLDWKTRALLFAIDRIEALPALREACAQCQFVVLDRYVESNVAYLVSEVTTVIEKQRRAEWIDHVEYAVVGLPRPDVTIVLELDPRLAQQLLRAERAVQDVNERLAYQELVVQAFAAQSTDQKLRLRIAVGAQGIIRSPHEVHAHIVQALTDVKVFPKKFSRGRLKT